MTIELKIINIPRTSRENKLNQMYKLKIIKKDVDIKVNLTREELIELYEQADVCMEIMV